MATPSICLCTELLKPNSTEAVAAVRILVKSVFGIVGGKNLLLYKVSGET